MRPGPALPTVPAVNNAPRKEKTTGTHRLVLFYEDFDAAIRLRRSLDIIVRRLGLSGPVSSSAWSFAMLAQREFNAAVSSETALADVVVISANGAHKLPEHIASWLDLAAMRNGRNAPPTVVVLHEEKTSEADGAELPLCASVRRIATTHGAGFMCHMGGAPTAERAAQDFRARTGSGIAEPAFQSRRHTLAPFPRHWGIND